MTQDSWCCRNPVWYNAHKSLPLKYWNAKWWCYELNWRMPGHVCKESIIFCLLNTLIVLTIFLLFIELSRILSKPVVLLNWNTASVVSMSQRYFFLTTAFRLFICLSIPLSLTAMYLISWTGSSEGYKNRRILVSVCYRYFFPNQV